jgi:phytoene dehydrogenase-like protein
LMGGRAALAQELKKEFPDLGAPIDDFLQRLSQHDRALSHFLADAPHLPPESLRERMHVWRHGRAVQRFAAPADALALDGLFGDIPRGHPIRWLFEGTQMLVGDTATMTDPLLPTLHRMAQTFLGNPPPALDRSALLAMLWTAAERAGISVRRDTVVRKLAVDGKRVTHLTVEGDRHTYRADYYLHSTQDPLSALLTAGDPPSPAKHQPPLPAQGGWLRWQWTVTNQVLPKAMAPQVVVLDGRRQARGATRRADAPFVLQRGKATAEGMVTLTVTLPWQNLAGETDNESRDARALWAQVAPRLRRILPQLPVDMQAPPATPLAHVRYGCGPKSLWGITGRSRKTALYNVVHCGRDVVPGLGLEGEYLAALGAVRLINARARWN